MKVEDFTTRGATNDLTGLRFGKLSVIKPQEWDRLGKVLWLCKCDCGKTRRTRENSLLTGKAKSCGCDQPITSGAGKALIDLTGLKFGALVVIERGPNRGTQPQWLCRCICGIEKLIQGCYLRDGDSLSCGCLGWQYHKSIMQPLKGRRFERLLVLERVKNEDKSAKKRGVPLWRVVCDCGERRVVSGSSLLNGDTRSCGCLHLELQSLPLGVANRNAVLGNYKKRAFNMGRVWEIPDPVFDTLTQQDCHYCGLEPSNVGRKGISKFLYSGLDRVDSSLGYTETNVVPSCWTCNWMKRNLPPDAFLAHIKRIYNHQNKTLAAKA
jgi:hypothetical protein